MIKFRLWGMPKELQKAIDYLSKKEKLGEFTILSQSGSYADRGESRYSRVYLEIEFEETKGRV